MSRTKLLLIISIVAFLMPVLPPAQTFVQVKLALKDGKTSYRMGEGIVLDLSFMATKAGYGVDETDGPLDVISITPADGVVELDSAKSRVMPDFSVGRELPPGTPVHMALPLNVFYRFDKPARYSVHVTTHRPWFRPIRGQVYESSENDVTRGVRTNAVSFDVREMSDAEEDDVVENLMNSITPVAQRLTSPLIDQRRQQFREDIARAEELGHQLEWLRGDPSTRAKANIILHPEIFGLFVGHALDGVETARNQKLLVTLLEQGMQHETYAINVARVAGLTARLRAKLDGLTPEQTRELERDYLYGISK